jgi:acetolactate synthase-1/2/3 large subunit
MNGGELFVECLKAQGVEAIFGMPGGHLDAVYEGLYKNRDLIRHYVGRHEGGLAFMADGYARAKGDAGVCMTVPGPGANNASVGVGEAYTACSPVLLITGQNPSHLAKKDPGKMFHGLDQATAFAPMTKRIELVRDVKDIPGAVNRAFGALRSGRPKPVLIELASDALNAKAENLPIPARNNGVRPAASPASVQAAIQLIEKSRRPFILAGGGINHTRATAELLEFASLLNAPVATTAMGKGGMPEDSPRSLRVFRSKITQTAMNESDLLIAIGTRFTYRDTSYWSMEIPQPLLHIEADPAEINKDYPATVGVGADPKCVLQQLNAELKHIKRTDGWGDSVTELHRQAASVERPRIIADLRDAMPRDAILTVDVHMTGYAALHNFTVYEPGTYIFSGVYVAMGIGLPAAIGAQIAHPNRKVVALCGDGGFLMNSPDLATAVKYNLPIVTIVMNDNMLTSIERGQVNRFGASIGVKLVNPDFVKFAEAFGAVGLRVEDEADFRPTLEKALALDKPSVIEVIKRNA